MREVTVTRYCDAHLPDRERASTERTVLDSAGKPKRLDLCGAHDKEYEAWERLADEHGVEPEKPKRATRKRAASRNATAHEDRTCNECGFVAAHPQGLATHKAAHRRQEATA